MVQKSLLLVSASSLHSHFSAGEKKQITFNICMYFCIYLQHQLLDFDCDLLSFFHDLNLLPTQLAANKKVLVNLT